MDPSFKVPVPGMKALEWNTAKGWGEFPLCRVITKRQNCWGTHSTHGILLPLLPSGSDGFHKATLREAQQNCQYFIFLTCAVECLDCKQIAMSLSHWLSFSRT